MPALAYSVSLKSIEAIFGARGFTPSALFSSGEQGAWYDPSDFSTMFQDSAGTTPVTAVEQPVGLLLDKSKGLALGSELVTNGDFSNGTTGWEGFTANTTISNVSGTLKQQVASGVSAAARPTSGFATVVGRTYKLSYEVVEVGAGASSAKAYVGTSSGTTAGGASGPATNAAGQFSLFFVASAATYYLTTEHIGAVGTYTRYDNISVRELPGNHASQSTDASRPVLKQDGNGKYYLFFDGVDDSLATGTIDPGAVDKAQVFAGVRKIIENSGVICETSVNSYTEPGISLWASDPLAGATLKFALMANVSTGYAANYTASAAPTSAVLSGTFDAAQTAGADEIKLRINGALASASNTAGTSLGSGNFNSKVLYVGRRAGTANPFNGQVYSLIVRFSAANLSDAQIASTETYVNSKTGAY